MANPALYAASYEIAETTRMCTCAEPDSRNRTDRQPGCLVGIREGEHYVCYSGEDGPVSYCMVCGIATWYATWWFQFWSWIKYRT